MSSPKGLDPQQAAALQEFASAVRDLLGSRLIALKLFGSQVRGEGTPDSDLDVLVAVEEASPALENAILDLAFQVNLAHDVYISPRVIARQAFEDPVWGSTPFIRTLQDEGAPCEAGARGPGEASHGVGPRDAGRHACDELLQRLIAEE